MRVRANFKTFLAVAVGCIALLSVAWIWLGVGYNSLVIGVLSPVAPDTVILEQDGHDIQVIVPGEEGDSEDSSSTAVHSMAMTYGLIVAVSVLLAVPRLRLRARITLLLATVLVAFLSHEVGLYILVQRLESVAPGRHEVGRLPAARPSVRLAVHSFSHLGTGLVASVEPHAGAQPLRHHLSSVTARPRWSEALPPNSEKPLDFRSRDVQM